jgi:polysaccharide deacetylase family protein (PEP-CTERM system associated)
VTDGALTNAMTVDVEDYFHVSALSQAIERNQWDSLESRVERNTRRLLKLFGTRGIRATFFVLGWVAERYPGLVREIAAQGHEVGCHGYSHRLVYDQSPAEFREETLRAKAILEQAIGSRVRGYRAASFSIGRDNLWALDTLVEAGFEYDSSIAPMRHDIYGWSDGPRSIGHIEAPNGGGLVEFPVTLAEWLGRRVPVAGGGYFRLLPYWVVRAGLRQINSGQKVPFFFYLHPWEIDAGQPRVAADWKSRFRHYNGLDGCEQKLERLLGEFRFGAMEDVLAGLLPART